MRSAFQDRKVNSIVWHLHAVFLALLAVCIFTGCGRGYVVDKAKNEVVFETWDEGRGTVRAMVTNADAATFEVLKLPGPKNFARDKNHVYLFGLLVPSGHPESFRRFDIPGEPHMPRGANFYYYRDSERVFIYPYSLGGFITMLPDSDPESFRVITNGLLRERVGWSRDRTRVYDFDMGFVPRDINSFEPLVRVWSRDSKAYYWETHEVVEADRNTFHISEQQPWFASDSKHLFWQGCLIEGCDPQTFHITSATSGYDSRFTYQFEEVWPPNRSDVQKINVHKQPLK